MNTSMISNRLRGETSPYLLQHADNPVDWYPWGDEAFEKALSEDKPIFLSVGYSACHWCHVMAHESFEDEQVAAILNRAFVPIKVDREERPDVDAVYMEACRLMTGGGGWPLTVFLTPDQKPFYAGTYYPKRSGYGRPGLIELLEVVEKEWRTNHKAILKNAEILVSELNKEEKTGHLHGFSDTISAQYSYLKHTFDTVYGGFGQAPKFPMPSNLLFLAEYGKRRKDASAIKMFFATLDAMYRGGIYDHIGGGFARYSTDREWLVPHFEKMLYDNAQLIKVYSEAYLQSGKELYKEILMECSNYLSKELQNGEGGFYSAQDADSEGREGLYYLFSPEEIDKVLGKESGARFAKAYGITPSGNFEGKSIPNLIGKELLHPSDYRNEKEQLYVFRKKRMKLHIDDKYLSFWNALAADGLASAYKSTGEEGLLTLARNALAFIKNKLTDGKNVYTSYKNGKHTMGCVLEDAAAYISACIGLYNATFEEHYLKEAYARTEFVINEFWDDEKGGFFLTPHSGQKLISRPKEFYDGVTPSGNALMYYNILYLTEAEGIILAEVRKEIKDKLAKFLDKTGSAAAQGYYAYAKLKEEHFARLVCVIPEDTDRQSFIDDHREALFAYDIVLFTPPTDTYKLMGGLVTFYACESGACHPPANVLPQI